MKVIIIQASKQNPIGNTVTVAKLYKGRTLVGSCIDTPNAIATAIAHGKGTRAVNGFGEKVKMPAARVASCRANPLTFSGFVAA